jgi:hypothetical protein
MIKAIASRLLAAAVAAAAPRVLAMIIKGMKKGMKG